MTRRSDEAQLGHRAELELLCYDAPYTAIVEPWAEEFQVEPGTRCRVVALNPRVVPTFAVELSRARLVVYVMQGGSTYEFWRGAMKEFETPVPIPGLPEFTE